MTAGYSTLNELKESKNIYSKLNELGEFTRKGLGKSFGERVIITGKGSLFMTHFVKNGVQEVTNSTDVARCDSELLKK